jgi:hypothetical protein
MDDGGVGGAGGFAQLTVAAPDERWRHGRGWGFAYFLAPCYRRRSAVEAARGEGSCRSHKKS